MSLVAISAHVSINPVLGALVRLGRVDFTKVFRKLRKPMHLDQRQHRDAQRGPRGPWAPLASSTKARYAREGKRRNRRILARLPNARITKVTHDKLTMLSRVRKWSMAHQAGGRVGHGSVLPQRQFLWISRQLEREAARMFTRALIRRWLGLSL